MREPTGSWPTRRERFATWCCNGVRRQRDERGGDDHVFYDVFGQQDAPETAGSGQAATQVGFQGMLIDPLAGFHFVGGGSGGGGGGYAPANSATGLTTPPSRASTTRFPRPTSPARPATPAAR